MDEQRVIDEYSALLDRSQQLFSGLRDVPNFGKQWQPYFQRTFEVYTKLWKFQQIHRSVLEGSKERERFSFKRHDIGEIASKIGQLYYHYYLRTSETNYLFESYIFYEAIRTRGYFKDVLDAKNSAPMVKKLRYYARFIVVCLLLNKRQMVETLAAELTQQVEAYIKVFRPSDTQEWQFVLQEITLFLKADGVVSYENSFAPSRRLNVRDDSNPRVKVQEAILVGNYHHQVKFSELTLDMFRIMQALEREPNSTNIDELKDGVPDVDRLNAKGRRNPHKYLLYRPTMSQLMAFLANSFKESLDNNVLLLYISADGIADPVVELDPELGHQHPEISDELRRGGIALNSRRSPEKQPHGITADCFYPQDLISYTRKHLFLIIDSDNSAVFSSLPSLFGKQLLCLLSPKMQPDQILDATKAGSMFTMFLCDPITAFFFVMDKTSVSKELYEQCSTIKDSFNEEAFNLLVDYPVISPAFLQEEYLRNFILNYVFCAVTLMNHTLFQASNEYWPAVHPSLPMEFYRHKNLQTRVYDLAEVLDATHLLMASVEEINELN